jgi:hypothetical protein
MISIYVVSVRLNCEPLFCVKEVWVLEYGKLYVRTDVEQPKEILRLLKQNEDRSANQLDYHVLKIRTLEVR